MKKLKLFGHTARKLALGWTFSALFAITGCMQDSNAESVVAEGSFMVLQSSPVQTGGRTSTKQFKILTDQTSYENELALYSTETASNPDFSEGRVLLLDMGPRRAGGRSIKVTKTEVLVDQLRVSVLTRVPDTNCIVTQAQENPFQFVYVLTTKEIVISETRETYTCN